MHIFKQLTTIFALLLVGNLIHELLPFPIPGNIYGMILLLLLLSFKIIKVEMIEQVSDFLLTYMAFFFLPAATGMMKSFHLIQGEFIKFLAIIIISTILVATVAGVTTQLLLKVFKK